MWAIRGQPTSGAVQRPVMKGKATIVIRRVTDHVTDHVTCVCFVGAVMVPAGVTDLATLRAMDVNTTLSQDAMDPARPLTASRDPTRVAGSATSAALKSAPWGNTAKPARRKQPLQTQHACPAPTAPSAPFSTVRNWPETTHLCIREMLWALVMLGRCWARHGHGLPQAMLLVRSG